MTSVLRPSGVVPVTVRNHHGPSASCLRRPFRRSRFSLSRSNAALKVCGAAMCWTVRPISQLKVSSRSTFTSRLSSDAGTLDLELVGRRVGERLHVEQRLAAARLDVEHVAQQVLLLEAVRALRLGSVEQSLLRVGAAGLQIVERVLVGFEADDLAMRGCEYLVACDSLGLPSFHSRA